MRRAYVKAQVDVREAVLIAMDWAGAGASLHVPDTRSADENAWIEGLGVPIWSSSSKSRFHARPNPGVAIAFLPSRAELLTIEDHEIEGVVLVPASREHSPWITAFGAECLGGCEVPLTPGAPGSVRSVIAGISQGVLDKRGTLLRRERSRAVHALSYLRSKSATVDPDAVMVEFLRNGWRGANVEEVRSIAVDLNRGKQLRFEKRLRTEALDRWFEAGA